MIIDYTRKPDFYILIGDKGYPRGYYKDKDKIPPPQSATDFYEIQEGYFDDVTKKYHLTK